jgi:uncharacterized protein
MSRTPGKPDSRLPATINPIQLAEQGVRLSGRLPIKGMRRLAEMCLEDRSEVSIDLEFGRTAAEGTHEIQGLLSATVRATCQRCLEPMDLVLNAEVQLFLVRANGQEDLQMTETDFMVGDKPVSLSELVEDELLLRMPMIPMHDSQRCSVKQVVSGRGPTSPPSVRPNPFSVLGKLKHRKK